MRDFGFICQCAIRYAFNQGTYVSTIVTEFILNNLNIITRGYRESIKKEVEEAIDSYTGSSFFDDEVWKNFLKELKIWN